MVKFVKASIPAGRLRAAVVLGAIGLGLSGCVVYPSRYGYGYGGYGGGYYAPAYVAPAVVVGVGGGWGWGGGCCWRGGWGGGWHGGGWGGGGHWH